MGMEGKDNGTGMVKEGGAPQEGEGAITKQSSARWLDVLNCPNSGTTPLLQVLALLVHPSIPIDASVPCRIAQIVSGTRISLSYLQSADNVTCCLLF